MCFRVNARARKFRDDDFDDDDEPVELSVEAWVRVVVVVVVVRVAVVVDETDGRREERPDVGRQNLPAAIMIDISGDSCVGKCRFESLNDSRPSRFHVLCCQPGLSCMLGSRQRYFHPQPVKGWQISRPRIIPVL